MKPKKRQKLCHNCEGEVDLDVIVCTFCAADLREEKPEQLKLRTAYSPRTYSNEQMSESLYPHSQVERETAAPLIEKDESSENSLGQTIGGMVLLSVGIQLFLFSCFLLFCSNEGTLTLKWNSRFWVLYLFASLPLILFGSRIFSKL
jgi:hypothetical protein